MTEAEVADGHVRMVVEDAFSRPRRWTAPLR
jgi:hypothetical protein